jgi:undecaprenyl diphosphate synthase
MEECGWWESLVAAALSLGPVPAHVAFIMDGNRRWARKRGLAVAKGHELGYHKLEQTLRWCLALGVRHVSVFAFSSENFSRPREEVNALFALAEKQFTQMLEDDHILQKLRVRVRVLGDLERLPSSLQVLIHEVVDKSKHFEALTLSICLAYSSSVEMDHVLSCVSKQVKLGKTSPEDISPEVLSQFLYTADSPYPDPDMIIRTSGETRLSDFMLWQGTRSFLSFPSAFWPDLSILQFALAILEYQRAESFRRAIEAA